ncbi:DUF4129 domain-containing protein [Haloarcula nitratireducens]|uniref:DUF4129 domain-containing protein n=1 Tax=Haloarcula nitratireducens TaxID=2487749 RepID=A0AAW4PCV1_9EURY|nr:DUF4129 domain-containing protein [Halomicroarcula nitratireducens]MBX0295739.1 DUF4129 domain-containing protein [Halomicroarcula nitratireducens]
MPTDDELQCSPRGRVTMDRAQLLSIGVAVLCMATLGVAGTTLDSTVSSAPADVLDVDFDSQPVGQGSAEAIDESIESNRERVERRDGSNARERQRQSSESDAKSGQRGSSGGASSQSEDASTDSPRSLVEQLLELLRLILPYALAALAAGAVVALAYRYRARIAALALAFVPDGDGRAGASDSIAGPWDDGQFGDDVHRAWYAMVTHLDIDRPWAKTADECRRRAVEAGLDPEAVGRLTEVFREVRYAESGPTPDHERRARESLARLDLGGEST